MPALLLGVSPADRNGLGVQVQEVALHTEAVAKPADKSLFGDAEQVAEYAEGDGASQDVALESLLRYLAHGKTEGSDSSDQDQVGDHLRWDLEASVGVIQARGAVVKEDAADLQPIDGRNPSLSGNVDQRSPIERL